MRPHSDIAVDENFKVTTIVTNVCGIFSLRLSVSLSLMRGHSVQPLPNDFGLLLILWRVGGDVYR